MSKGCQGWCRCCSGAVVNVLTIHGRSGMEVSRRGGDSSTIKRISFAQIWKEWDTHIPFDDLKQSFEGSRVKRVTNHQSDDLSSTL